MTDYNFYCASFIRLTVLFIHLYPKDKYFAGWRKIRYRLKEKIVHSSGESNVFIDFRLFPPLLKRKFVQIINGIYL